MDSLVLLAAAVEVVVNPRYFLSEHERAAMAEAIFEKIQDGTYSGRIPSCKGVLAFGGSRRACEAELRSTLQDWLWLGLKLGHPLPVPRG